MTINVRIFTPRGIIWEGVAQSVILPSSDGEMGIPRGHIPLSLVGKNEDKFVTRILGR